MGPFREEDAFSLAGSQSSLILNIQCSIFKDVPWYWAFLIFTTGMLIVEHCFG
jgi:hypothetical protein